MIVSILLKNVNDYLHAAIKPIIVSILNTVPRRISRINKKIKNDRDVSWKKFRCKATLIQ